MKIAKDYANNRPRQMAHTTQQMPRSTDAARARMARRRKKYDAGIIIIAGFFAVMVAGFWLMLTSEPSGSAPSRVAAHAVTDAATGAHISAPSETPTVHQATAYPTATPAPASVAQSVVIVTRVVRVTEVVRITQVVGVRATPVPTATPNATATWQAAVAQITLDAMRADVRRESVEVSAEVRREVWMWVASIAGALILLGGAVWWVGAIVRAEYLRKLDSASGETERADVEQSARMEVSRELADAIALISASIERYGADASRILSARAAREALGWRGMERWTQSVRSMRDAGLPVISIDGGGGGTALDGIALREALLRLRIAATPPPTEVVGSSGT